MKNILWSQKLKIYFYIAEKCKQSSPGRSLHLGSATLPLVSFWSVCGASGHLCCSLQIHLLVWSAEKKKKNQHFKILMTWTWPYRWFNFIFYWFLSCNIIKNACDAYKSINHLLNQAEKNNCGCSIMISVSSVPGKSFNCANEKLCNSPYGISSSNHSN